MSFCKKISKNPISDIEKIFFDLKTKINLITQTSKYTFEIIPEKSPKFVVNCSFKKKLGEGTFGSVSSYQTDIPNFYFAIKYFATKHDVFNEVAICKKLKGRCKILPCKYLNNYDDIKDISIDKNIMIFTNYEWHS